MILHASVVADEPRTAAETLAALLGGIALPLGPGDGTWSSFKSFFDGFIRLVPTKLHAFLAGRSRRPLNARPTVKSDHRSSARLYFS